MRASGAPLGGLGLYELPEVGGTAELGFSAHAQKTSRTALSLSAARAGLREAIGIGVGEPLRGGDAVPGVERDAGKTCFDHGGELRAEVRIVRAS